MNIEVNKILKTYLKICCSYQLSATYSVQYPKEYFYYCLQSRSQTFYRERAKRGQLKIFLILKKIKNIRKFSISSK